MLAGGSARFFNLGQDKVCCDLPLKGLGQVLVMDSDIPSDFLSQLVDTAEGVAVEQTSLELGKPAFGGIEPGGARGGKVQVESRSPGQPIGEPFRNLRCRQTLSADQDHLRPLGHRALGVGGLQPELQNLSIRLLVVVSIGGVLLPCPQPW